MFARRFLMFAAAFALTSAFATPAHAQLGKIGGAIKKKAKEAAADAAGVKEESKPAASTAAGTTAAAKPAASPPVAINSDAIDRMIKGMAAEATRRETAAKYPACEEATLKSAEVNSILMSAGPELEKIQDDKQLSDAQKNEQVMRVVEGIDKKKEEIVLRRCGVKVEISVAQFEEAGAAEAGFTRVQYGTLKERIAPFCTAAAKGGSVPPNSKYVYTEEEIAAMRPRCAALLASLKRLS
jgi:hypothetical protein